VTFAIAAFSPQPFLETWLPNELLGQNGIILLADTRYSWRNGRFDRGTKIVRLGSHAGCVGAGGVLEVRHAAAALKPFFAHEHLPNAGEAETFLVETLTAFNKSLYTNANAALYWLGVAYVDARYKLHIFGWGPHGTLAQRDWGFVFGQCQYTGDFEDVMRKRVETARERGSIGLTPDSALLEYSIGLHDLFMEREIEPSVGGGLQAAIITHDDGLLPREVYFAVNTGTEPPLQFFNNTPEVTFDWNSRDEPMPVHERGVFAISKGPPIARAGLRQ
jgi:20S proteasome alpha/beta subunit